MRRIAEGVDLTPTALCVLRGIDEIGRSQTARARAWSDTENEQLVGYELLGRYTGASTGSLHAAVRQLRGLGLITCRHVPQRKGYYLVFGLTKEGVDLLAGNRAICGIESPGEEVVQAMADTYYRTVVVRQERECADAAAEMWGLEDEPSISGAVRA